MATGYNEEDASHSASGGGFWGRPLSQPLGAERFSEEDEGEEAWFSAQPSRGGWNPSYTTNPPASERDAFEAASEAGSESEVESEDLDSTGKLPRITDEMARAAQESAATARAADSSEPNVLRDSWAFDDELYGRTPAAPFAQQAASGQTLAAQTPDMSTSGSPANLYGGDADGYIDVSMGYDDAAAAYNQPAPARKRHLSARTRKALIALAAVAALVAIYLNGVQRYEGKMLPNARVDGLVVEGLTQQETQRALEQETADYTLAIQVDDFSLTVDGKDIAIERDEERMAKQAMDDQQPKRWPIALLKGRDTLVDQGVKFDEEALANLIRPAVAERNDAVIPADGASIVFSEETGAYTLEGTTSGTAVDADAVLEAATEAVKHFSATCAPDESAAIHEATVHDIPRYENTTNWANLARSTDVPITVNGDAVIVSEAGQNAQWVQVVDGPAVNVDAEAVRIWAQYYVADAVAHQDDYNYYRLDEDAFVTQFCQRLATGDVSPFEAPVTEERTREGLSRDAAYARGGWDESLGRYIDVDLEAQFARLFDENGEVIWESAFVSGNMLEGHPTITGTFQIYNMQQGATLVGMDYNGDGEPDYESYVNYWMPFLDGFGLHDATWRNAFGGDLYQYDGSHGCVNLPYEKAAELYGLTHVGETVNVHW